MATRRSTRRTAASAEPAPPELAQDSQDVSAAAELPRKRTRKGKAAAAAVDAALVEPESQSQSRSQPHSQSHSQSQPTKASATSRAASASTKTTTTTAATAVTKRTTRAAKAAGDGSPLRVLQSPERKRKTFRGRTTSATPEPPQPEPAHDHDSDDNDQGIFFSKSEPLVSSLLPPSTPLISSLQDNDHKSSSPSPSPSKPGNLFSLHHQAPVSPFQSAKELAFKIENEGLRDKISQLEARILQLEKANVNLVNEKERVVEAYDNLFDKFVSLECEALKHPRSRSLVSSSPSSPSSHFSRSPSPSPSPPPSQPAAPPLQTPQPASPPLRPVQSASPSPIRPPKPTPPSHHTRFPQLGFQTRRLPLFSLSSPPGSSQPPTWGYTETPAPKPAFKVDIPKHIDDMFAAMAAGEWDHKADKLKTDTSKTGFDAQLRNLPTTSPLRPMFISGSESAYALLTKLETAAKEPLQGKEAATKDAASSRSDLEVNMDCPPQPLPTKRTYEESTTPARPIVPSSFFTRSFSALKSIKSLFSTPTPKAPSPPKASSPPKAAPPPNSLTETLSTPPTPVGERAKTPAKKNKVDRLMRTLLKGIDPSDERKAAEWARQIIPSLKNDDAFREKRKRLEKRVLLKDLNNLPSAKPWETGFGDPLADMDDDDVVPVWAVYLDMIAEEEERVAKKHKKTHDEAAMDFEDVPTINEQYAASQSARSSRRRFDGHGRSASDLGSYPRRSIVPSPMFDTSLSHHRGENVFNELQGHDTAAKIRTNDREALQAATKASPQPHDSGTGSFSVPDDSDEDDSSIIGETDGNVSSPAASVWTQAPPPAPVPAHAPLPGGAAADTSPATATEKPVDEIERQRQRLMKHTPAKPSRLREATYPSPSLFSDAGNDSILMATPEQTAAAMNTIFNSMPGAEMIQLEPEEQAALDAIVGSDAYKQELATPWDPPIVSYDSDEEDLSPV
ncbi:hypothetical protein J1614_003454 [Plenodomus biglobosus]|nr:hypothetical protein J1614_003454 [Plenodomus biglobosus]